MNKINYLILSAFFCFVLFCCTFNKTNRSELSDMAGVNADTVFIRDTVYVEKISSNFDDDYLPGNKKYKPLENNKILLDDFDIIDWFLWITDIYVSPEFYYEDSDEEYDEDYSNGYKYRLIVMLSDIYTCLYIDKLILGMEGTITKQEWSKEIPWDNEICQKFELSYETSNIKSVKWINANSFSFQVTNSKSLFLGIISEKGDKVELNVQLLKK